MHQVNSQSKDNIHCVMYLLLIPSGNDTTQTITIIAGTNSSMVNVPVTDDNIVEGDETFSMSFTVPSSLSPGITTGTITSATVTIIDTTGKHVTVRSDSSIVMVMYVIRNYSKVCIKPIHWNRSFRICISDSGTGWGSICLSI